MPRESQTESSNPFLRNTLILCVLACLVLAFLLYKRAARTDHEAGEAAKLHQSLSNLVAELQTKLALEHSTTSMGQTIQQTAFDRCAANLTLASNRLVQTHLLFTTAQSEARAAQAELQAKAATIATIEAQRDELNRRLGTLPPLQQELAAAKEKLELALFGHDDLAQTLGRVRLEKAELERKLDNPDFLRLQTRKADDAADIRRRLGAGHRINASDKRLPLALQPDGTVRPVLPPAS